MFKRSAQSTGTVIQATVEKKRFKRAEAAIYLGITTVSIDRLTKRGLLHPSRALRHPIYSRDDLDRFLKETAGIILKEIKII
jgi:DNA-binding transcriptional MerR regulator